MYLQFEKWAACGNDFVIVYMNQYQEHLIAQAKALCERSGNGIGADGILILSGEGVPSKLTIVNADGSIAKNCGNGLRCAAQSIKNKFARQLGENDPVFLEVLGREFTCYFNSFQHNQKSVEVVMGNIVLDENNDWHHAVVERVENFINNKSITNIDEIHTADLGNKHVVLFTKNLDDSLLAECAENLKSLNLSLNVHMACEQTNDLEAVCVNFKALCYENGCGFTKACGTGACSIAAAALLSDFYDRSQWVNISMPGGALLIKQEEAEDSVLLSGPCRKIFEGNLDL